jgi:myo-inositol-1(or 4)-monophosphatase
MNEFLDIALQAAHLGGAVLRKHWGKLNQISHKETSIDLVTEADRESEQTILSFIHKKFPHHSILSEETGLSEKNQNEFLWIIDPLDGTTNYTHQFPFVSISIALWIAGEGTVGVVYNPIMEELFQAVKGHGAKLNQKKIEVSGVSSLNDSLLASGFPYDRRENADNNYAEFCCLTHLTQGVRRAGSAALDLSYVAAGRLDGYWERGIKPWDIAAGVILLTEAGGRVTSYDNQSLEIYDDRLLASNGLIHEAISYELLKTSGYILD